MVNIISNSMIYRFNGVPDYSFTTNTGYNNGPDLKRWISVVQGNGNITDGILVIPSGDYYVSIKSESDTIVINNPITIKFETGARIIWGDGSWTASGPIPLFAVMNTNNIVFDNPHFVYLGEFNNGATTLNGSGTASRFGTSNTHPFYTYNVDIWVENSNNTIIHNIRSEGATKTKELWGAVSLMSADATHQTHNNFVSGVFSETSNGVYCVGQDRANISVKMLNYGNASIVTNGHSHMIYTDYNNLYNTNMNIHDCVDLGIMLPNYTTSGGASYGGYSSGSHSLLLSGLSNSTISNIRSNRAEGILSLNDVQNNSFDNLRWMNNLDVTTDTSASIVFTNLQNTSTVNSNCHFTNTELVSLTPKNFGMITIGTATTGPQQTNHSFDSATNIVHLIDTSWNTTHTPVVKMRGTNCNINFGYTNLGPSTAWRTLVDDSNSDSTGNAYNILHWSDNTNFNISGNSTNVSTRNTFTCYNNDSLITPTFI